MLKGIPDFEVVGETDLSGTIERARDGSTNMFLIELTETGLQGLRVIAALTRTVPSTPVVVLTSSQNPSYIRSLLAIGISAYVLRSASNSQLYQAIRFAHRGKQYLDPRVSDSITYSPLAGRNGVTSKPQTKRLSRREAQVLSEIARGFTSKDIAQKLGVGKSTIQTYRERIYNKLELRSRADLVHYAVAFGMLDIADRSS